MTPEERLEIWDGESKTDPAHTKEVSFGSYKFTAVDAYYQIERATRRWGPLGLDWKVDVDWEVMPQQGRFPETNASDLFVIAFITVTYPVSSNGEWRSGKVEAEGSANLYTSKKIYANGKQTGSQWLPDIDAYKKARTDGITKALSYLGFSADVFTGLYDDNKYVAALWAEKHETERAVAATVDREAKAPRSELPVTPEAAETHQHAQDVADAEAQHRKDAGPEPAREPGDEPAADPLPKTHEEWATFDRHDRYGNNILYVGLISLVCHMAGKEAIKELSTHIKEKGYDNLNLTPVDYIRNLLKKTQRRYAAVMVLEKSGAKADAIHNFIRSAGGVMDFEPDALPQADDQGEKSKESEDDLPF